MVMVMTRSARRRLPLAFLPMSEKRPGPFMAMAASSGRGREWRGRRPPIEGEEKGEVRPSEGAATRSWVGLDK